MPCSGICLLNLPLDWENLSNHIMTHLSDLLGAISKMSGYFYTNYYRRSKPLV